LFEKIQLLDLQRVVVNDFLVVVLGKGMLVIQRVVVKDFLFVVLGKGMLVILKFR
jgi:hypothetical protein